MDDVAHAGVDIEQMVGRLREELDVAAFERAWAAITARHPVLRTRFRWEGLERPVQEVLAAVPTPFSHHDLRGQSREEQEHGVERYLEDDRRRGVDFAVAPLFRVALFQLGPFDFRIVWTYSHALLDGCVSAVLREVYAAYEADRQGTVAVLEERRPYRDHIEWLDRHLADNAGRARTFFRGLLAGYTSPAGLDALAVKHDAPSRGRAREAWSGYGATCFRLSRETSDSLRALSKTHDLRDPTLVEAAWALVLSAFSGADDVVFGSTRACRRSALPGSDSTIGLFINTLPVRARLEPSTPVVAFLKELRAQQVASRAVEQTPLVDVLACAQLPRGTSLFDTLVVVNDVHNDTRLKALGGPWLARDFDWHDQTNFPVSLMAYGDEQMHFKLSYDRRRFDDLAMARVAELVTLVLDEIARVTPETKLADLPSISPRERALVESWNVTNVEYPRDATVHGQFAEQAARTPEAIAVVFRDASMTYRELDARSTALAAELRGLGTRPDDRIAIFADRSLEMMVGLLAILKAGAAYVPMDPAYPAERITMMLEDAKAKAVVTTSRVRARLPAVQAPVIEIDGVRAESAHATSVEADAGPENLAYVIFTSGSTGRPKGVMVRHRNVVNFFTAMDRVLGRDAGTWLALTSISF
ncbi:MAG: condensation domain-containing protein, partial [Polyangiales bacterium]